MINQRDYKFAQVQAEIDWLRLRGGIFNKLNVINDVDLWLKLNLGRTNGLDEALISRKDSKHIFWLFLLKLQQNQLGEAQTVLNEISDNQQYLLSQGLLALASGNPQQTIDIWENHTNELGHLTRSSQTLWHLAMAQAEIATNIQLDQARNELQCAQTLEPKNPACLTVAFEIALKTRDWDQAVLISKMIDEQKSIKNPGFLTEKAILALQIQDNALLESSLAELKTIPKGLNYVNYILGIQALSQGDLDQGKSYLRGALQNGLDGIFMADAQQALAQTEIRLNSEKDLRPIIQSNGE
ncbi:MAG: tetratricopeptide repeat protein [Desulfitobacteriaceae bacterium]